MRKANFLETLLIVIVMMVMTYLSAIGVVFVCDILFNIESPDAKMGIFILASVAYVKLLKICLQKKKHKRLQQVA